MSATRLRLWGHVEEVQGEALRTHPPLAGARGSVDPRVVAPIPCPSLKCAAGAAVGPRRRGSVRSDLRRRSISGRRRSTSGWRPIGWRRPSSVTPGGGSGSALSKRTAPWWASRRCGATWPKHDGAEVPLAEVMVPQHHPLGEEAEVDFGSISVYLCGLLVDVPMFIMHLSASGRSYPRAYLNEAQEVFLDGRVRAFDHFAGAPGSIRPENVPRNGSVPECVMWPLAVSSISGGGERPCRLAPAARTHGPPSSRAHEWGVRRPPRSIGAVPGQLGQVPAPPDRG